MRTKNLSSEGQRNLDQLLSLTKARLNNVDKAKSADRLGNTVYVDFFIYSKETLESFVDLAISEFNAIPKFTDFTLEDSRFVDCFAEILVEGAVLHALASQALLERGREFMIKEDGLHFDPPAVSDMLNAQYQVLLGHHYQKLKYIKIEISSFIK